MPIFYKVRALSPKHKNHSSHSYFKFVLHNMLIVLNILNIRMGLSRFLKRKHDVVFSTGYMVWYHKTVCKNWFKYLFSAKLGIKTCESAKQCDSCLRHKLTHNLIFDKIRKVNKGIRAISFLKTKSQESEGLRAKNLSVILKLIWVNLWDRLSSSY